MIPYLLSQHHLEKEVILHGYGHIMTKLLQMKLTNLMQFAKFVEMLTKLKIQKVTNGQNVMERERWLGI